MPQINILNVLQGDSQSTVVDKVNYNFDQILSAGGGPQGLSGSMGSTGPIGPQGSQGVQGLQGASGTKWFVQDAEPASGAIGGNNPFLYPTFGDYWLDPDDSNQEMYVFGATGWLDTGFGLAQGSLWVNVPGITIPGSSGAEGVMLGGVDLNNKSVIISDADSTEYNLAGNTNFENSKLKLSTKDDRRKIISFSRSDYDVSVGGSGDTSVPPNPNPSIEWDMASAVTGQYYDISFLNPTGSIGIKSLGASGDSGINLLSNGEILAQSNEDNVTLSTYATSKGTFIKINSTKGFFEISSVSATGNATDANMFVNATGVGIGIGTGGFKESGEDARKLAILGNISISTDASKHTEDLFIGGNTGAPNYAKGSLFVEGYSTFGHTGPDGFSNFSATGDAEAALLRAQNIISCGSYGPALTINSLDPNSSIGHFFGRTVIGDGELENDDRSAGRGTDITQEINISSLLNVPPRTGGFGEAIPLAVTQEQTFIAYRHKITDPTNITKNTAFAIKTKFNNIVNADSTEVIEHTKIETLNYNNRLFIQSNGDSDNKVLSGTNDTVVIGIHQGGETGKDSTTIGYDADINIGIGNIPTSVASFTAPGPTGDTTSIVNNNTHALVVAGTQTIGTTDAVSAFESAVNQDGCVSAASMLKVHRIVYGETGANQPNGMEISSFNIPGYAPLGNENGSVALAIGWRSGTGDKANNGFLVSNSGTHVAIGSCVDYNVALKITTTNDTDTAIETNGMVKARGVTPIGGIILAGTGTYFTSGGTGILDWEGWALCDGQTHASVVTPTLTGPVNSGTGSDPVYVIRIN